MATDICENTHAPSNYGLKKHKRITPEELVELPFHTCLPLGRSSPLIYSLMMITTSAPSNVLKEYFCAAQTILETHGIDAIGYCDRMGRTALSWAIYGINKLGTRKRITNTCEAMDLAERLSRIAHKIITLTSNTDETCSEINLEGDPSYNAFLQAGIYYRNYLKRRTLIFPTLHLQGILYHMLYKAIKYEWSEHDLGMDCMYNDITVHPLLRMNPDFERMSQVIIDNSYKSWD